MNIEKPIEILVRRRAAIGDAIMATGVLRELKMKYGDNARIHVATEFMEVFRTNPWIASIYHTDHMPDLKNFDVYINLDDAYECNPVNQYVDGYFYRGIDSTDDNKTVEVFPDAEDRALVDRYLEEIDSEFISVHMRQWHWSAKNISPDVWYSVFEKLFEQTTDFKIVCIGGPTDFSIANHPLFLSRIGLYNSQQMKYLMDHAQCFVGIDSGPFQCAAASSTHIVALLTHLHPDRILPYRNGQRGYNCTAIQSLEDCAGCNDNQQRPVRQLQCIKQDFRCVKNFDTDAIAQAILKQL